MKVYITGANSRLGYYVMKYVKGKGLGRRKSSYVDIVTSYEEEELKKLLKDADVVIHLAGKVFGSYKELLRSNVLLTEKIVNAIPKKTKLIFASSISVYGKSIKEGDENSPLNPDTDYAKTKAMAEEIVKEHKNYVILRIGTLYGEKYELYFKVFDLLRKGRMPLIGNNRVPFTYAGDVGKAFKNSISKKGVYVVSSQGYPVDYVIKISAKLLEVKEPRFRIPKTCLRFASFLNKFLKLSDFLNEEVVLSLTSDRTFNPKKAMKELKFRITPIKDGVKRMVEIYKKLKPHA